MVCTEVQYIYTSGTTDICTIQLVDGSVAKPKIVLGTWTVVTTLQSSDSHDAYTGEYWMSECGMCESLCEQDSYGVKTFRLP